MTRADLAEAMVPVACDLACRVRDGDADGIARLASSLSEPEVRALIIVLAAMVPVEDMSQADMLAWTERLEEPPGGFTEPMLPFPAGRPVTEPCGTYAAYRRHERRGEPADAGCVAAYAEYHRRSARESMARCRERKDAAREKQDAA